MIFLYIKRHLLTGKKYFGRTIKNPFKYNGSGPYWLRHIKKHSVQYVITEEVYGFDSQELCTEFALKFSHLNDIVKSSLWANQTYEDGVRTGLIHTSQTKQKISNKLKGSKRPWAADTLRNVHKNWANGNTIHPSTMRWKITTPSGEILIIDNLAYFCKQNKLSAGNFVKHGKTKGFTAERIGITRDLEHINI